MPVIKAVLGELITGEVMEYSEHRVNKQLGQRSQRKGAELKRLGSDVVSLSLPWRYYLTKEYAWDPAVFGRLNQSLIRRDQLKAVALSHALVQHIGATKQVMRRKLFPVIRI